MAWPLSRSRIDGVVYGGSFAGTKREGHRVVAFSLSLTKERG